MKLWKSVTEIDTPSCPTVKSRTEKLSHINRLWHQCCRVGWCSSPRVTIPNLVTVAQTILGVIITVKSNQNVESKWQSVESKMGKWGSNFVKIWSYWRILRHNIPWSLKMSASGELCSPYLPPGSSPDPTWALPLQDPTGTSVPQTPSFVESKKILRLYVLVFMEICQKKNWTMVSPFFKVTQGHWDWRFNRTNSTYDLLVMHIKHKDLSGTISEISGDFGHC